jgi:fibronectin type 3 domain-containing protein
MRKLTFAAVLLSLLLLAVPAHAQAAPGFTKISSQQTGTSFVDGTCPLQSTCYYQVTSVDSAGHESVPSACATAQLCFAGNQAVATMPSSGTHSVAVSWTAPTLPAGTTVTYNLYRSIGPPAPSSVSAVVN